MHLSSTRVWSSAIGLHWLTRTHPARLRKWRLIGHAIHHRNESNSAE